MKIQATLVCLLVSLPLINTANAQVGQLKIDESFTLQSFQTMEGTTINLDSIENKVFVMNFWNIGCRGCEAERPYLNELHEQYRGKDVVFWSITMNTEAHLAPFLEKHPINWEIKEGVDFVGLQGDKTFLIGCMPTTIVIDKQRKVIYNQCGPILENLNGQEFINLLDTALSN